MEVIFMTMKLLVVRYHLKIHILESICFVKFEATLVFPQLTKWVSLSIGYHLKRKTYFVCVCKFWSYLSFSLADKVIIVDVVGKVTLLLQLGNIWLNYQRLNFFQTSLYFHHCCPSSNFNVMIVIVKTCIIW